MFWSRSSKSRIAFVGNAWQPDVSFSIDDSLLREKGIVVPAETILAALIAGFVAKLCAQVPRSHQVVAFRLVSDTMFSAVGVDSVDLSTPPALLVTEEREYFRPFPMGDLPGEYSATLALRPEGAKPAVHSLTTGVPLRAGLMEAVTACCSAVDWALRNLPTDARKNLFLGLGPVMQAVGGGETFTAWQGLGNIGATHVLRASERSRS